MDATIPFVDANHNPKENIGRDTRHCFSSIQEEAEMYQPFFGNILPSDDPISYSRFRDYQADQWTEMFEELCAFIKKNGHCQVPHGYPTNESSLARWTKRQRYQYKLRLEDKPSTMTEDRIGALNALGFV
jgi:hypothetical protein